LGFVVAVKYIVAGIKNGVAFFDDNIDVSIVDKPVAQACYRSGYGYLGDTRIVKGVRTYSLSALPSSKLTLVRVSI